MTIFKIALLILLTVYLLANLGAFYRVKKKGQFDITRIDVFLEKRPIIIQYIVHISVLVAVLPAIGLLHLDKLMTKLFAK